MHRCAWANTALSITYHDEEWGVPQHDDRVLFEFLILEGAQAGLSWETILKKRQGYRRAFNSFDPELVARYDQTKANALLADPEIIRNRLKVASAITNAQMFLQVRSEFGSFDTYIWAFAPDSRTAGSHGEAERVTRTTQSDAMSKDLRKRGFRFVGTTICHAFMQAVGMVNDHERACFRHREIAKLSTSRPQQPVA